MQGLHLVASHERREFSAVRRGSAAASLDSVWQGRQDQEANLEGPACFDEEERAHSPSLRDDNVGRSARQGDNPDEDQASRCLKTESQLTRRLFVLSRKHV